MKVLLWISLRLQVCPTSIGYLPLQQPSAGKSDWLFWLGLEFNRTHVQACPQVILLAGGGTLTGPVCGSPQVLRLSEGTMKLVPSFICQLVTEVVFPHDTLPHH